MSSGDGLGMLQRALDRLVIRRGDRRREPVALRQVFGRINTHRGDRDDFSYRLRIAANVARREGEAGIKAMSKKLLVSIANDHNLEMALSHLAAHGGRSPGPDKMCYSEITIPSQRFCVLRQLRDEIKTQSYYPGSYNTRRIRKPSGNGYREIALENIGDRVVGRAAKQVLELLLDPQFDANSFGARPNRNRVDALARAEKLAQKGNRYVWISQDIRNAFPSVPLGPLLDIVRHRLMASNVVQLVGRIIRYLGKRNRRKRGLLQGNPLSPLLLNAYLDHHLDRQWRKRFPKVPLVRYIDDILVLCRSLEEAVEAHKELEKLLNAAGMPLKHSQERAIRDLSQDQHAIFLGYRCALDGQGLKVSIAWRAVDSLVMFLGELAGDPNAGMLAAHRIMSWLLDAAPGYVPDEAAEICCEIQSAIYDLGLENTEVLFPADRWLCLSSSAQLQNLWRELHADWRDGRPSLDNAALCLPECGVSFTSKAPVTGLCVDASWDQRSRLMEYRGVWLHDRTVAFQAGPIPTGSNNIGEYLAIVQGLRLLSEMGLTIPVYSDSFTAINWAAKRQAGPGVRTSNAVEEELGAATQWLRTCSPANPVLKWDTEAWGEIPADYGRK